MDVHERVGIEQHEVSDLTYDDTADVTVDTEYPSRSRRRSDERFCR